MKTRKRWFHASPARLRIGTEIFGGHRPNYKASDRNSVYITSEEIPHFTIAGDIRDAKVPWHVYEVKPHGRIEIGLWDDGVVKSATIIRYVGNARGILNRLARNTNPRKPKIGSIVKLLPESKCCQIWSDYARMCAKRNVDVFGKPIKPKV